MCVDDNPPPPLSTTDKIIPFSIPKKVPIKLDLEKYNYNFWSSFSLIHLGLKSHVETDTASTNPEWCQLDDLIKMWILGFLCDSLQEQVDARAINLNNELRSVNIGKITVNEYCTKIKSMSNRLKNLDCEVSEKNLVIYVANGLDSRFATLVEIIRHREPVPTFETVRNMLLLKESSFNDDSGASTFDSSSSSPSILMATTSSDNKVTKPLTPPTTFVSTSSSTWHQRLEHPEDEVLHSLSSRQFISCNKAKSTHVCHACQLGKHVKLPFHSSNSLAKQSFDIIHSDLWTSPITHTMVTRSQRGIVKPIERLSLHTSFVSPIHKSSFLALKDPNWCNAMYDEYNALVENGTWILVPRPTDVNLRSLYGLKQAPRAWFQRFAGYATRAGFSPSRCDSSLFIYTQGSQQIVDSLHKELDLTDLGAFNYFLGLSVVRHPTGLFLSQKKYALQLLERAHMVNCNSSRIPVDTDSKLGPDGVPVQDPILYRSLAVGLQYLTFTRPDLSYVVQQVCVYMHDPRELHFAALKRILRYVQGTLELGLHLYASATTSLVGGIPGVANVVAKTARIRNLLRELHSPLLTAVYCDNVSAVYMSANPVQHQCTNHIEIDIHFVRDMVKAGHVWVLHAPSRFQYADIFAIGLPSALFEDFQSSLSVHPSPAQTAGAY
nr:ribonuclease H-like domain-containing protein [Tanacetum cinerariifolium]